MSDNTPLRSIERRTFLKTSAVVTGGTIVTGIVGAAGDEPDPSEPPKPENHDVHWGESDTEGGVWTYATTNPANELSSLGVHIDATAMDAFGEEERAAHLHFPTESGECDLDVHQFTFMGFHYNPMGHPPPEIYDVPHFDFHFYMIDEAVVEDISGGPLGDAPFPFVGLADYEVPEAQWPCEYMFEEHRFIVEEMGEHLLDGTAPEFHGEEFTHTYVYGAYDPSIDLESPDGFESVELQGESVELPVYEGSGEGRLHFVEPMITTDFIRNDLDDAVEVDVATPERFFEADDYPTQYVVKADGDGGVYVSIDDFEELPGPSE